MTPRLIRPFLVVEFLIAVQVWLTLWSQVGGQYHLDLMFWPWKFGLTMAAAWLITAITGNLFHNAGEVTRKAVIYIALLFGVVALAGVVTYYYHMNEPADEQNGDEQTTLTWRGPVEEGEGRNILQIRRLMKPHAASGSYKV